VRPTKAEVGLKQDLPLAEAATAERNDAPQELVEKIRNADTQRFNGPDEVLQAVQGR
jgi:hypothetical protein